jgi:predicted nucleic-acid-binding Zn-ribbon protein
MIHLYAEVSCDCCGYAEHFNVDKGKRANVDRMARQYGGIITKDG